MNESAKGIIVREAKIVYRPDDSILKPGLWLMIESWKAGLWCAEWVRLDEE